MDIKDYNLAERRKDILRLEPTIKDNSIERNKLRREIADKILKQGSFNIKTGKLENPVFFNARIDYVMGIPGSGKSTILANPLSGKYNSLIIDSDMAKELLPEYEGGLGADRVHKESKFIFKLALEDAIKNSTNIVVSIVGKSMESIMDIYNVAKEHGYEQHLHLNEVPPTVACDRAIERFRLIGRYIDPNYILNEVGYKPSENYETLKEMNIFNSYEKYNNNVPFGEKPILTERIIKEDQTEIDMEDEWEQEL